MRTKRGVLEGPVIPLPALSDPASFRMCANGSDLFVSINEGPYLGLGAGTGVPGAPDTSVQFNAGGGAFGGSVDFTFDGSNVTFANVAFVDGGIDLSGAGVLEIGEVNASSIRIAAAGQAVNFGGDVQVTVGLTAQTITIDGLAGDAQMRIVERAGDPAAVANSGFVYTKDDAAVTQLFFRDSSGTVHQLTPAAGGTPGGSPGDVQFNNAGNFDGDSAFTFDGSTVTIANTLLLGNGITLSNGADHTILVEATAVSVAGRNLTVTGGTTALNPAGNGAGGGGVSIAAGAGGNTTNVGSFGGAGGDREEIGGRGGSADQATSGGGFGGNWSGEGGAGGDGTNSATGGQGGPALVRGGFGGDSFAGIGGKGGPASLLGGLGANNGGGGDVFVAGGGGAGGDAGFVRIGRAPTLNVEIGDSISNPPITIVGGLFTVGGSFVHAGAAGSDTFEVNAPASNNQAVAILGAGGEEFLIIDTAGGDEIRIGSTGTGDATISIGDAGSFIGFFGRANFGGLPNAYTVTNPVDRRSYDTATITLLELAEVVGTIIADHKTWNLFQ